MSFRGWMAAVGLLLASGVMPAPLHAADEPLFSGPQVGEPLPSLPVQLVLEEDPTQKLDVARGESAAPARLVVFVHTLTRPSVAFTRMLGEYAASRKQDGIETAVVFLGDDPTALAASLRRARHALPKKVTIGISPDGAEGPGAFGLNRNVTLTVLVANEGRVTANYALVDPSIPVDLPKVLQAICDVIGGEPPAVESLQSASRERPAMRKKPGKQREAKDPS